MKPKRPVQLKDRKLGPKNTINLFPTYVDLGLPWYEQRMPLMTIFTLDMVNNRELDNTKEQLKLLCIAKLVTLSVVMKNLLHTHTHTHKIRKLLFKVYWLAKSPYST